MKIVKKTSSNSRKNGSQSATTKTRHKIVQTDASVVQPSKFVELMNKKKIENLKERFSQYYGKNFPIEYKNSYEFEEEWQGSMHNSQQGEKQAIFQNQNFLYTALFFAVMCFNTIMIWMNTVQTFFTDRSSIFSHPSLFVLGMILEAASAALKIGLSEERRLEKKAALVEIFSKSYKNIVVFCYFLLKVAEIHKNIPIFCWLLIQGLCIYVMYRKARNIYRSFKLTNFALLYEYQFKITDIILNLIIIAHFISIVLYESTKCGFEDTWITFAGIEGESAIVKYVYSFYFCCTTILTVGYGDITPRNYVEVIVVTFVEIFGIIAFANFINQIGYSLTEIRNRSESIEKELLVIQKMKKWYRMDEDLSKRARIHIINNKALDSQLSPEEEKGVMMKLSEELRHEIEDVNSLKIVKSSVFFLLRWSNSFQKAISLRLCNIMLPPGELLYQPSGKERVYIVREGKIDIYASKRGFKRGVNTKILKTIQNSLGQEVSNNVYGYTSIMSRRPVQLYAVAKKHTSGYYVEKEKFLDCIHDRQADFQFFHQLKQTIDDAPCWESVEVPTLNSSKHHYNPTRSYIFRRLNREKCNQKRSYCERNMQRKSRVAINNQTQDFASLRKTHATLCELTSSAHRQIKTLVPIPIQFQEQQSLCHPVVEVGKNLHHYFESSKEYTNYFPKNNRTQVMRKFQIEMGVVCLVEEEKKHSIFFDALKEYRTTLDSQKLDQSNK